MKFAKTVRLFGAATVASLLMAPAAQADSGFQIGVSIGESNVTDELNIEDEKIRTEVGRLRELSPLWEMFKDGIDLKSIQWAAH